MGNVFSSLPSAVYYAYVFVSYSSAVVFYLAPLPTVITVWKDRTIKRTSPVLVPYLATLMNSMMWLLYCQPRVPSRKDRSIIIPVHIFGVVAEAVFVSIFLVFSPRKLRLIMFILAEFALFASIAAVTLFGVHAHDRFRLTGILCVISGTIMHVSPVWMMIKTRSVPISMLLSGTIYASFWTALGLFQSLLYVAIQNGIGVFFGILQLVLCRYYLRSTDDDEDKVEDEDEVEEGRYYFRSTDDDNDDEVEDGDEDEVRSTDDDDDDEDKDEVKDEDEVEEEGVLTQSESVQGQEGQQIRQREFTILIVFPDSRRGQQVHCSPLVESGETIGTVITLRVE